MILFLSGILIGIFSAVLGLGGGVFIVPLLVYYKLPIHKAIGTSIACILFTSFSASLAYIFQKKVLYKEGLLIIIFSTSGAWVGAHTTSLLPNHILKAFFGIFLIILSIKFFLQKNEPFSFKFPESLHLKFFIFTFASFLAGFLAGFLGIGGGIIFVPLLTGFSVPIHNAVATSSFLVWITSLSGVIKHYFLNNIEIKFLFYLVPGLFIGAQIGAQIAKSLSSRKLNFIFGIAVIFIALKFILECLKLI